MRRRGTARRWNSSSRNRFSTGVELAGGGGMYAMIWVAGVTAGLCEEVDVV